ncbi:hypothetical protein RchiOBHm_Chr7g0184511 [Rosa chinensis]|uniref:Uncharacterized protein n=1 Tax=Rosa chinensis TaxID=74649 RepID=A0A2P6P3E4_ROSCH|nr:uncharacterized protein LOC112180696 [Rosa chinensis]PRQ16463.1 hypothetical protein RchiOBHm_Chr7g0184511 [Rosa chinensis]
MVRRLRTNSEADSDSYPIRLSSKARLLASVSALMDIASRLTHKLKAKPMIKTSSLNRPKQLMATISNKAITLMHRKKVAGGGAGPKGGGALEEEEWGDGGVWQRSILMGDKCEPLDFSGVIYYDSKGQQLNGAPLRSPRASPLPGYLERAQKI